MNARSLPLVGHGAAASIAPWIEGLARVGFAAKGVLYLTVGALAAGAALGWGGKAGADSQHAMSQLVSTSFGRPLLAVIALGLVGYAVWRIIEGITDPERRGKDAKGIALRLGFIARGIVHLALAGTAASFALWQRGGQSSGEDAKLWTGRALDVPGGVYLLWAAAAGFVGYGVYQIYKGWRSKLAKQLDLGKLRREMGQVLIGVSRFGIAARGVVFGMIGVMLARAARSENPGEAGGLSESMKELVGLGKWPFIAIALGLAAYGIYNFINARYRRIECR